MSRHRSETPHMDRFVYGLFIVMLISGFAYMGGKSAEEVGMQIEFGAIIGIAVIPLSYVVGYTAIGLNRRLDS